MLFSEESIRTQAKHFPVWAMIPWRVWLTFWDRWGKRMNETDNTTLKKKKDSSNRQNYLFELDTKPIKKQRLEDLSRLSKATQLVSGTHVLAWQWQSLCSSILPYCLFRKAKRNWRSPWKPHLFPSLRQLILDLKASYRHRERRNKTWGWE